MFSVGSCNGRWRRIVVSFCINLQVVANVSRFEGSLQFVNVSEDHSIVQVDLNRAAVTDLQNRHPPEVALSEDIKVTNQMTWLEEFFLVMKKT